MIQKNRIELINITISLLSAELKEKK